MVAHHNLLRRTVSEFVGHKAGLQYRTHHLQQFDDGTVPVVQGSVVGNDAVFRTIPIDAVNGRRVTR